MGIPETDNIREMDRPSGSGMSRVRCGLNAGVGAGSMLALLLVLSVMPGAAAFAAPEAVGHISIILHEVVRPKPDRDPRETRDTDRQAGDVLRSPTTRAVTAVVPNVEYATDPGFAVDAEHRQRAEMFAACPWCASTPPPLG